MAGRVNTKFVFLLSGVLVLLIAGIVGFWFVFVARSADEQIRQGDMEMAQGNVEQAIRLYGKAVAKRSGDVQLLEKYIDAMSQAEVTNTPTARKYLELTLESMRLISENTNDPARLQSYYQQLVDWSDELGAGFNERLFAATNQRLQFDPSNIEAHKYRGIAQVRRIRFGQDVDRDGRLQARDDLRLAFEQQPDDVELLHHLALWNLAEAARIDPPGRNPTDRPDEAQQLRDEALELSRKMLAAGPEDPDRQLRHLTVLLDGQFVDEAAQEFKYVEEARPVAQQLEATLLDTAVRPQMLLELASVLPRLDRDSDPEGSPMVTEGRLRAAALLSAAAQRDPNNVVFRYALGMLLMQMGEQDAALSEFAAARQLGVSGDMVGALRATELQVQAAYRAGQILLAKAEASDAQEAEQLRHQAREMLAAVEAVTLQSAMTDELKGKILRSEGDLAEAQKYIDRASEKMNNTNVELLLLSADLSRKQQALGSAIARYQQVLESRPDLNRVRVELARAQLQAGQTEAALQEVDRALVAEPGLQGALQLKSAILLQQGKADEAMALYGQLPQDSAEALRLRAAGLAASGEREQAFEVARTLMAKDPADMGAVQLALRLATTPEQRLAVLDEAQQGGADPAQVQMLRRALEIQAAGEGLDDEQRQAMQQDLLDEFVQAQKDPVARALAEHKLLTARGEAEEAQQALARAAAEAPTDPRVIEAQFESAVARGDFEQAQQVVNRAASANIDAAGGDFYRGRLAAAQGNHQKAVIDYRRALEQRSVYPVGWRLLGMSLLQIEQVNEAIDALNRAVEQSPNDAVALLGLAQAHGRSGEPELALQAMREVVRHRPTAELMNRYLALEQQFGEKQRALQLRQQLATQRPQDHENRRALAALQAELGQRMQAMATLESLVAESGQNTQNMAATVAVHSQLGEVDAARALLRQYIASRGTEVSVDDYRLLAAFELRQNDLPAALQAYQSARAMEDPKTMPVTRELADLLFGRRETEQAVALYRQVQAADPTDERVRLRLAEALTRLGENEEASQLLSGGDNDQVESLVLRAMLARDAGDDVEALRLINQAVKRREGSADLYFQRAMLLRGQEGRERAVLDDLNRALAADPRHTQSRVLLAELHLQAGRSDAAERELRAVLDRSPDNTAVRLQLVNLLGSRGELTQARILVQDAMSQWPNQAVWPPILAQLASRQGDTDTQIRAWRQAMQMSPAPATLSNLIMALLQAGRAGDAMPLFTEFAGMVQGEPVLQALRGRTLAMTGQSEPARQVFINALSRAQNDEQVLSVTRQMVMAMPRPEALSLLKGVAGSQPQLQLGYELAMAELEMSQGEHAAAADRLAALEPAVPADHRLRSQLEQVLGLTLLSSGRHEQAEQVYRRILDRQPDNVGALNNLAYMLAQNLNRPEEALPLAEKAAGLQPSDAFVLDTLGLIQYQVGRRDRALETLSRSVGLRELSANTFHLGRLMAEDGSTLRARELLQRSVELAKAENDQKLADEAQQWLSRLDQ